MADAHAGRVDSAAAARLVAALGAADDESGPWSVPELFERFCIEWVVALHELFRHLNDDALCERWADQVGEFWPITDALRVEYMRDLIGSEKFGYECENAMSAVLAVPLRASDGRSAVLGGTAAQQGNVGYKLDWLGVFRNEAELLNSLESARRYRLERIAELPHAKLLEAWDK